MNGSLPSESLVALIGVISPRRLSELTVRAAQSYPDRIRRRLASFLAAEESAPLKWERPPEQGDLWKTLNETLDLDETVAHLEGVPDDMAMGYPIIVQSARDYIKSKWPIFPNESLGLANAELAPDEYGDVWQIARTLDDPQTMFDDLDALVLLPDQVDAFATVYPDLYEQTVNIGLLLLQPFVAVDGMTTKKKKVLPFAREEAIRTLLRLPIDAPIPLPEQEQAKPQSQGASKQDQRTTTQSERVADKSAK